MGLKARAIVFEKPETASLFRQVYPELEEGAYLVTLDELLVMALPEMASALDPERRKHAFLELLSPEQKAEAERYQGTLETLREALILRHEDVDFAFNALASVPKNRALRDLFHRYLDSELSSDRTQAAVTIIDRAKRGHGISASVSRFLFVGADTPGYLISELSAALAGVEQIEESLCIASCDLPLLDAKAPTIRRPGLVLHGSPSRCLARLGEHVSSLVKRGVAPEKILVPFRGSEDEKRFLCHYLDSRGITQEDLTLPSQVQPSTRSAAYSLVEALRADTCRPLKARLALGSILVQESCYSRPGESAETFLARLQSIQKISQEEKTYLLNLPLQKRADPPPLKSQAVRLVPFGAYPLMSDRYFLGYADSEIYQSPRTSLLLRPRELEALQTAGFPLPRPSAHRAFIDGVLGKLGSPAVSRRIYFAAFEPALLPEGVMRFAVRPAISLHSSTPQWRTPTPANYLRTLSATQLETYAKCPTQYFFSHQLKLRRNDSLDRTYPILFGLAVHLTLENFFKNPPEQTEQPIETVLMEGFEKALGTLVPSLPKEHSLFTILTENFRRLGRKVAPLENQLKELIGQSTAVAHEQGFEITVGGLTLRGKIDRINQTPKGTLLVLDYKTGTVSFSPDHVAQGEHFQALLYILAVEKLYDQPPQGILFYDLKKGELRRGILIEEQVPKEAKKKVTRGHVLKREAFNNLREAGLEKLKQIADRIATGDFEPTPNPFACSYCDFTALCRQGFGYA